MRDLRDFTVTVPLLQVTEYGFRVPALPPTPNTTLPNFILFLFFYVLV